MRVFTFAAALLASVANASTLTPPLLPLVVRNPYLSTWLPNAREQPWSKWPMFWTGAEVGFPPEGLAAMMLIAFIGWLQRPCIPA